MISQQSAAPRISVPAPRPAPAQRLRALLLSPNAIRTASVAVFFVIWEYYGRRMDPIFMAPPSAIFEAAVTLIQSGALEKAMVQTLWPFAVGMALTVVVGILLGIVMAQWRTFEYVLDPFINALYAQGHEIASHAVGHFDGGRWSAAQWEQEFASYRDIFANAGDKARAATSRLDVPFAKVVGFRAPYLAAGSGLYEALRHDGFRYDTSGISYPDQWPQKRDGLWRFNLETVKIHGLGRGTLSMDYNFIVAQSHGVADPRRAELFKEQMLATYLDYFRASYTGNRAPLNIGHHFEAYQGGVYNEALKEFARRVCGLPEVKCATYTELADFMDQQTPGTIAAYQRADFPHAPEPALSARLAPWRSN